MSNQITTQTISFHGSDLITLKVEDVIYTAVRPIVEALGLSWSTQKQKLDKSKDKFGCVHMNTPTNGGMQSMLCMPLKKLNGWLFSINPEKVRPDLKDKVICYQEECFEALYNYWFNGKAKRLQKSAEIAPLTITPEQQQQIQNAVQATHHRTGLSYAEIYQRLKAKFHVAKYDQLRQDQHREAMIFIAGMSAIVTKTESGNMLKLSLIDVMSLLVYLKKVNRQFAQVLGLVRHIRNHYDIHDLDTLLEDFRDRLLDEDYRHFLKLINDYAKECDPYHKTLLKSTLTIN